MERAFLVSSTLCFLAGFAYSMYALGAKVRQPSRWNFIVMLVGFALQLGFLELRSAAVGRCPLTNLFEVLVFLMRHPGRAFRREELLQQVWGYTYGDTSTVTVHIRRLREKIEPDPAAPTRIGTVWGVGYRWQGAA